VTDFASGGSAFSSAIQSGDVYADDGSVHKSIQSAVDSANAFVFIGPATFSESVTVSGSDMLITGSGTATTVDGGSSAAFDARGDSVEIRRMNVRSTAFRAIWLYGNHGAARQIKCDSAGGNIVQTQGDYCLGEEIMNDGSGASNSVYAGGNYGIFDRLINSAGVNDNGTGNVVGESS